MRAPENRQLQEEQAMARQHMAQQQKVDQTHPYRMQTLESRHLTQVQAVSRAPAPRPAAPQQHGNSAAHGVPQGGPQHGRR